MLTLNSESIPSIKRDHALKNKILVYVSCQDSQSYNQTPLEMH